MNFLAHLWLAEHARVPLAGAILGDWLRGPLPAVLPPALAVSVQLHRQIDAATDRHPVVRAARARFPDGPRRYAGILLDLLFDHALARDWAHYSPEQSLDAFAQRAAVEVAAAAEWFDHAGGPTPRAEPFRTLLLSYRTPQGFERAVHRTAQRLRHPAGLLDAMENWTAHLPELADDLPVLLGDLRRLAPTTKVQ